jgi:hypothetical protein
MSGVFAACGRGAQMVCVGGARGAMIDPRRGPNFPEVRPSESRMVAQNGHAAVFHRGVPAGDAFSARL